MKNVRDTRARLLDAAEESFAREGINGTATQEITRRAGQRNTSALHYYFGSRAGLLDAVLARHLADVEVLRSTMADGLVERRATGDLKALVQALVLPLGSKLGSRSGRNYLLILQQTIGMVAFQSPPSGSPDSLKRLLGWLSRALDHLPNAVAAARLRFAVTAMVGAMATRVADTDATAKPLLDDRSFLDNLVEMLSGAMVQPHCQYRRARKQRG